MKDKRESSRRGGESEIDTSVSNNVPEADEDGEILDDDFTQMSETEKNLYYSVSKTVKNRIYQIGKVNKVSVAVLLNDQEGKLSQYERENREQQIVEIVAAVGYDEHREDSVVVHTMGAVVSPSAWRPCHMAMPERFGTEEVEQQRFG